MSKLKMSLGFIWLALMFIGASVAVILLGVVFLIAASAGMWSPVVEIGWDYGRQRSLNLIAKLHKTYEGRAQQ